MRGDEFLSPRHLEVYRREEGKERKEREREGGRGAKKLTDSAESFETLNLASEF